MLRESEQEARAKLKEANEDLERDEQIFSAKMLEMAKLQKKTEELYNSNELLVAQLSALRMRSSKAPTKEAETLHSSVQTDGNVDKEKVFTEHNIEEALKERVKELESEIAKLRAAPAKRVEESESAVKFHNMASRSALDEMDEVLYHNAEDLLGFHGVIEACSFKIGRVQCAACAQRAISCRIAAKDVLPAFHGAPGEDLGEARFPNARFSG